VGIVNERKIVGGGTAESEWEACPLIAHLPATDIEAILPVGRRMVMVSPHPDDEILGAGGLLAKASALGREIFLVAVTGGEASHRDSLLWPTECLRKVRASERLAGLRALGLALPRICHLNIPDGSVNKARHLLRAALEALLRPHDVVFATWQFDGHPDHDTVGRVTNEVCARADISHYQLPVWMWHWAIPGDHRVPWDRLSVIALSAPIVEMKRRALSAHASQLSNDPSTGKEAIIPSTMRERLNRRWEAVIQ
jgi:LmbE family N-acetylglucosaminyl deacetylase